MKPHTPAHTAAFAPDAEVISTLRDLGRAYGSTFIMETLAGLGWDRPASDPRLHEQLREVLDLLHDHRRPSLRVDALRLAIGSDPRSFAEVATVHAVSRECVRLHVDKFRSSLGLPICGRTMTDAEKSPFATNGAVKKLVVGG